MRPMNSSIKSTGPSSACERSRVMPERDEVEVAAMLGRYVERLVPSRDAAGVARGVIAAPHRSSTTSRRRLSLGLALAAVLAGGGLLTVTSGIGIRSATAQVAGLRYEISVARSLQVTADDLTPYGEVSRYTDPGGYPFADTTAYALRGVDPTAALVVRWEEGLSDDAGSLGEYALLYRNLDDATSGMCAYYDPASPATPTGCP